MNDNEQHNQDSDDHEDSPGSQPSADLGKSDPSSAAGGRWSANWRRYRKYWLLMAPVAIVVFGFVGLGVYSGSPSFCNSCHIMKPYYKAWSTSNHSFVACVDCHYPPGTRNVLYAKFQNISQVVKYVTRTYGSKPYAEIEDAACLRSECHATRLLRGRVTFKRGIIFDHRPHVEERRRGRQLRCTSCHSQIVVGNHMEVTEDTCFLCHFKGVGPRKELPIGKCTLCHQMPAKTIRVGIVEMNHKDFAGTMGLGCQNCHQDVIEGKGRVPKERCFDCHNQPEKLAFFEDMPHLHDQHVAKGNIECRRCHEPILHAVKPATLPLEVNCASCHQGMHRGNSLLYAGTGGKGVPSMPSPMFLAQVDCVACHIIPVEHRGQPLGLPFSETTFEASEAACVSCHDSRYKGMKKKWGQTIKRALQQFKPKLKQAEKRLTDVSLTNTNYRTAVRLHDEAKYNFQFLTESNGVHNIYYASRLLQRANDNLNRVGELLNYTALPMGRNSLVNGGYCATLCHQQVGAKLLKTVVFDGTKLAHEKHFTQFKVGCANCHELGQHKSISMKIDKPGCLNCHHSLAPPRCESCHGAQARFYFGTVKISGVKPAANVMAKQVSCTGCHNLEEKHSLEQVAASCRACHGEGYDSILARWQTSLDDFAQKVQARIKEVQKDLVRTKDSSAKAKARGLLSRARKDLARLASAKGLHNPDLAEAVVQSAEKRVDQAAKFIKNYPPR